MFDNFKVKWNVHNVVEVITIIIQLTIKRNTTALKYSGPPPCEQVPVLGSNTYIPNPIKGTAHVIHELTLAAIAIHGF